MNLLTETRERIKHSGHTVGEIVFIGSRQSGHQCTWEQFEKMADREYDNGFGGQEVASDLEIVFSDGMTMWRQEYDGSEWWEYSLAFNQPKGRHEITALFVDQVSGVGWMTLEEIAEHQTEGGAE